MKGLFRRPVSGGDGSRSAGSGGGSEGGLQRQSTTSAAGGGPLGAQFTIPPFPNPLPERSLSLHCTRGGLVILPSRPTPSSSEAQQDGKRSLRSNHSPRPSLSGIVEDAASAKKGAQAAESGQGASLSWSKQAKPERVNAAEVKSLLGDDAALEIRCYGIVGIQRLFKGTCAALNG